MSLSDIRIYLKDGPSESDIGIGILHLSKGTSSVAYVNDYFFDSYGCAAPQKTSKFIIKRKGPFLNSDYKTQGLTRRKNSHCAAYGLNTVDPKKS